MTKKHAHCRIGTSGYQYDHWRGVLYEKGLAKKHWFARYTENFDTVEINNTFYQLPREETFKHWRSQAPKKFIYALKFSRYGTHMKRLKDPQAVLGKFIEHVKLLGPHLGPILVQLPPNWHADAERLNQFLTAAPKRYRWAVEFRDRDWLRDDIFDVLRQHNAALCIHDMLDKHPVVLTADWVYLRYHGKHYTGAYTYQYLTAQAQRIRTWLEAGHDVFAYFNNDSEGHAVHNARDLKRYVRDE